MGEKQIQEMGGAYLILRTSRVYSLPGKSFVNKVLGCSCKNTALKIVSAQLSNRTWTRALAYTTSSVLFETKNGLLESSGKNAACIMWRDAGIRLAISGQRKF